MCIFIFSRAIDIVSICGDTDVLLGGKYMFVDDKIISYLEKLYRIDINGKVFQDL